MLLSSPDDDYFAAGAGDINVEFKCNLGKQRGLS
jgi:hypothetical protein